MKIRGYFSKPKGVHAQKKCGKHCSPGIYRCGGDRDRMRDAASEQRLVNLPVTDLNPVSCPIGVSRNASFFEELQMLVRYVEETMTVNAAGMPFQYLRRDNYGSGFSTGTSARNSIGSSHVKYCGCKQIVDTRSNCRLRCRWREALMSRSVQTIRRPSRQCS
jgi:hypothetical protein